jgi:hypothetical protein
MPSRNPGNFGHPGSGGSTGWAAHQAELFQLLAERTSMTDREVLFHRLQAAGIPAGPVLLEHEVPTDPHVAGYAADEYAEFVAAGMIGCDYELGG